MALGTSTQMDDSVDVAQPQWTSRDALIVAPRRRDDVIVEELDGQAVLSDPQDGTVHRLNETSLAVWRLCDGRTATRTIAEELTRTYDVDFDTALDHVDQLLVLLAELNLLESPCN